MARRSACSGWRRSSRRLLLSASSPERRVRCWSSPPAAARLAFGSFAILGSRCFSSRRLLAGDLGLQGQTGNYTDHPTLRCAGAGAHHFRTAFGRGDLFGNLKNSLIVSGGSAAAQHGARGYAGYAAAKVRLPRQAPVMMLLLSAQVLPFGLLLITIYPVLVEGRLLDTHLGLILGLDRLRAARLDLHALQLLQPGARRADRGGAGGWRGRTQDLPHDRPAGLGAGAGDRHSSTPFMWSWNDLLYSMTLIVSEEKRTIGRGSSSIT